MRPRLWQRGRAVLTGKWVAVTLLFSLSIGAPLAAPPAWVELGDWGAWGSVSEVRTEAGARALWWGERVIELPAPVVTWAAGEFDRADGLRDLLVAVEGNTLLVFESPRGALDAPPFAIPLPHAIESIELGLFDDDFWFDALVRGDDHSTLISGRDRQLARHPEGDPIESAELWTQQPFEASRWVVPSSGGSTISATFIVNNPGDSSDLAPGDGVCATSAGNCTLRAAIEESNALPGPDTISFALGAGNPTILPSSPLPVIVDRVSILGNTGGATRVRLLGSNAGSLANGLFLGSQPPRTSSGSLIRALVIARFGQAGLRIESASNVVENCLIGTDLAGQLADGNASGGIVLTGTGATGNTIGGATPTARNLISGNTVAGVWLTAQANNNTVAGNRIGTSSAGQAAIPNIGSGIMLDTGAHNNTIGGAALAPGDPPGNLISGNSLSGIEISGSNTSGNLIQGNVIGLDAQRLLDLGNGDDGVRLISQANSNTIGGSAPSLANLISGNGSALAATADGVEISGSSNTVVQGNLIGVSGDGATATGNTGDGVNINDSAGSSTTNSVGGTSSGSGNTVSGNSGSGVRVGGSGSSSNTVSGNNVGTSSSGIITAEPGNRSAGIVAENGTTQLQIGGSASLTPGDCTGACNRIAHNSGDGVRVIGTFTERISIRGNAIASNVELGIDLADDGLTPNDQLDVDGGENRRQNSPVITSVTTNGFSTEIRGQIESTPNRSFEIELFGNITPDPSGFGEGRNWLGLTNAATNSDGLGLFQAIVPGVHTWITSTATDQFGNTSEFSRAFANPGEAQRMLVRRSVFSASALEISYIPACLADQHVVYVGITPIGAAVSWTQAHCFLGNSGAATFDPGTPPAGRAFYFVVVGQSANTEGPYGNARPEAAGAFACDRPMEVGAVCR